MELMFYFLLIMIIFALLGSVLFASIVIGAMIKTLSLAIIRSFSGGGQ